jgi:hypothetical protein
MKEITTPDLYNDAVTLLKDCNVHLNGNAQLSTINVKLIGVVKDLNDIIIKELTEAESETTK